MIVSLAGSLSWMTRNAKTMVASPRGPNQPMNSLSAVLVRVPIKQRKTGSIPDHGKAEHRIEHAGQVTRSIMWATTRE
jgi:hypothetical protein